MMTKLANYASRGRDNNFNLVRFMAALLVLVSHSYPLSTGDRFAEPLRQFVGITAGTIAVDVFFVTSGFLVTGSIFASRNVVAFSVARILRVYPGLICSTLATVLVSAFFLTSMPIVAFLTHQETLVYVVRNVSLIPDVSFLLPGVFEANPYQGAVNGSLWTLPIEVRMYVAIAVMWTATAVLKRWRKRAFEYAALAIAVLLMAVHIGRHTLGMPELPQVRMGAMFFWGAAFYICRNRISMDNRVAAVLLFGLVVASANREVFFFFYTLTIAYLVFYAVYLPAGRIRQFNRLGDYSYGIYVYAFPIQQLVASLMPGVTPTEMTLVAMVPTVAIAVLSWRYVEKPAHRLKSVILLRIGGGQQASAVARHIV